MFFVSGSDDSLVGDFIIAAYFGGMVQLGIALWSVGDCMSKWLSNLTVGTIFNNVTHETWLNQ
jgi:hypothetical protein